MPKAAGKDKEMDGVEKAAILLIALGPEKSAQIFKHLKEDEIEQLTLEIANTSSVSPSNRMTGSDFGCTGLKALGSKDITLPSRMFVFWERYPSFMGIFGSD